MIKVTIEDMPRFKKTYPWIGTNNNFIVLFTEPGKGIMMKSLKNEYHVGVFGHWSEYAYKPYVGKIIFEND